MAVNVYRRAGSTEHCELVIHGTAPLWSNREI